MAGPEDPQPEPAQPAVEPTKPQPEAEPSTPQPEIPEPSKPEPEVEPSTPQPEIPEPSKPEVPAPGDPEPSKPGPEIPEPEIPKPATPAPEVPAPNVPRVDIPPSDTSPSSSSSAAAKPSSAAAPSAPSATSASESPAPAASDASASTSSSATSSETSAPSAPSEPAPSSPTDASTPAATSSTAAVDETAKTDIEAPDLWDRTAIWLGKHGALPALGVLTVMTALMYGITFWGETNGDDLTFHMAEAARLADCLRVGDFDFWNPSANAGYASAYYYQVVPQLASAIPAAIFGHFLFWFQLSVWLPHVLAPAAAYRGMRLMGATPWQALVAAACVAFTSGASRWGSGADGTFQVGLYTQTWALAAFPLALGYGVRWISEARGVGAAIAWGAFVGLCHPFAGLGLGIALFVGWVARVFGRFEVTGWTLGLGLHLIPMGAIPLALGLWRDLWWLSVAGALISIAAVIACVVGLDRGDRIRWFKSRRVIGLVMIAAALVAIAAVSVLGKAGLGGALANGNKIVIAAIVLLVNGALAFVGMPRLVPLAIAGLAAAGIAASIALGEHTGGLAFAFDFTAVAGAATFFIVSGPDDLWGTPATRGLASELLRLLALGVLLVIAAMPGWITLVVDYAGFGGFPHRVDDEVGPGLAGLLFGRKTPEFFGYFQGGIFDNRRPMVMTATIPLVILFARGKFLRWLWTPALVFAVALAAGPHIGTTQDDLLPMVRFLGAMQIVLALGLGAGALWIGAQLWHAPDRSNTWWVARLGLFGGVVALALGLCIYVYWFATEASLPIMLGRAVLDWAFDDIQLIKVAVCVLILGLLGVAVVPMWRALRTQYGIRTGLAAAGAALGVLLLAGVPILSGRVYVLAQAENSHRDELMAVADELEKLPPGRKQVGTGAENHWWNLLTYVYGRRPSTLQMGGGGLQASPNYDFLWTSRDHVKNAWLFDAPYLVFARTNADKMPAGETVFTTANYEIRKLPAPGLVSPVQVTGVLPPGYHKNQPGHDAALNWLKTDMPKQDHVLAYDGSGAAGDPPAGKTIRSWRQDSPGDDADIVAEVHADKPTTFMARESWHPRWRAYIDGEPAPVRRVTPDFPAVDVPPGDHVVAFRFERPWWATASWLAWPATAVLAGLAMRRRRTNLPVARVVT